MNDAELDRLLDAWQPPAPRPSLRENLVARFPQTSTRRQFARPLRWVLAIGVSSMALALVMGQAGADSPEFRLPSHLMRLYYRFLFSLETRQAPQIVAQIRSADPKVFVDGQPAPPLEYAPAALINVQVPGDAVYSLAVYNLRLLGPNPLGGGWQAGRAHDRFIEFQAGGHQVRIECNQPVFDTERPVFVRRRP